MSKKSLETFSEVEISVPVATVRLAAEYYYKANNGRTFSQAMNVSLENIVQ